MHDTLLYALTDYTTRNGASLKLGLGLAATTNAQAAWKLTPSAALSASADSTPLSYHIAEVR